VVYTFLAPRLRGTVWTKQGQICESETMMLVIIGEKSERRILIGHCRLEDRSVPVNHFLKPPRAVNNVREFRRLCHIQLPRLLQFELSARDSNTSSQFVNTSEITFQNISLTMCCSSVKDHTQLG
jgi:hypothetical protein